MLRPHSAHYRFLDAAGGEGGREEMRIEPRAGGWLAVSRLEIVGPEALVCDVEWHLQPDLATRVLYMATTNAWGEEHTLELAVTGNGLLAGRTAPDGPTQVEMGWGPGVELDHLSVCFTTVLLARWDIADLPSREVKSVLIGAEDLVPEPLDQHYRVVGADARGVTSIERLTPSTGSRAGISLLDGGVVRDHERLFRLTDNWAFTD